MIKLDNTYVSIIGGARSGVAAARLCQQQGGMPFVSDLSTQNQQSAFERVLMDSGISYEYGKHSTRVLESELLVISPGVPSNAPIIVEALKNGIKVVSEIEFASWFFPGKIIAITGSNGKTTTTSLVGEIFKGSGKSFFVAGNIGYAFSDGVYNKSDAEWAVLEISSFQLDHIQSFRPYIAAITNISPDHLDRYNGSVEEYTKAKQRIFLNQCTDDYLVYNYDDTRSEEYTGSAVSRKVPVSITCELETGASLVNEQLSIADGSKHECKVATSTELQIKGSHNYMNALMGAMIADLAGVECTAIRSGVVDFAGVEHRLEFVVAIARVEWYNDSKATNVESTLTALKSFKKKIVLIAGGKDKGAPYDPLREIVSKAVKEILVIGEAADNIANALGDVTTVTKVSSMSEAVNRAHEIARENEVVLLSPACASFDMFKNYEERGTVYKELVMSLQ